MTIKNNTDTMTLKNNTDTITLKNNRDLLEAIHSIYGHSKERISGLADKLGLKAHTARKLAVEAGYCRHRLESNVSLDEFSGKPSARFVIKDKGLMVI